MLTEAPKTKKWLCNSFQTAWTTLGVCFALFLLLPGPLSDDVQHSFTTGCFPGDLPHRRPLPLIAFDPVCHADCNCHSLKAFKTIKSSSALGVWQYISALIRTLSSKS
ncbi:hypothetical protein ATANTOWER_018953 [Ataeniobius toweri]|uniref:Uncharacterized protein n=1 Tax=Ataeniobius toweri TaxID=208326 RepID=A0ABU7BA69_9TELE|nr:hypothetical protein [Ataeniobius toweri]